jgi:hypothetical protein
VLLSVMTALVSGRSLAQMVLPHIGQRVGVSKTTPP